MTLTVNAACSNIVAKSVPQQVSHCTEATKEVWEALFVDSNALLIECWCQVFSLEHFHSILFWIL